MKAILPIVTVLMPVYNGATFLRPAIESILHQTYQNFEFLIIDDGSTDSSLSIIQSYTDPRITFIRHKENQKLIATLNEGMKKASGELIARMDADDISEPNRLQEQVQFFNKHPDSVLVGSDFSIINTEDAIIAEEQTFLDNATIQLALTVTNAFAHGSVMFRKDAVSKVGGFSTKAYLIEDYELWSRLATVGKLANIPKPLYRWRVNPTGESSSKASQQAGAALKLAGTIWDSYGPNGPSARQIGESLKESRQQPASHLRKVAELHILLARERLRRHNRRSAIWHVLTAIQLYPLFPPFYFYLLSFGLPPALFFSLEARGMSMMQKVRGW